MESQEISAVKKSVAQKACEFIHSHMTVGIGSGSTVRFFIEALGLLCQRGLQIQGVASSNATHELALKWHIPMLDHEEVHEIDVTVDGADEIDPQKFMIKGGGGALFREKILAGSSKEMIVIIDQSKLSKTLGSRKLPIEIHPFCFPSTIKKINHLGFHGALRKKADQNAFVTDNGNFIYDVQYSSHKKNPEKDHISLLNIPGVVETGLFCHFSPKVIVGYPKGETKIY
ncbi:MAG: ribose 5-phosphate isomerase A [Simkaniaceae bacterium]